MFDLSSIKYGELHCHTCYSDGLSLPDTMAKRSKALGNAACGITDHGTNGGVIHHWQACIDSGIKPVLGNEFYIRLPDGYNPEKTQSRNSKSGRHHITMLSTSLKGYESLIEINNASHRNMEAIRGVKYPIVTFDILREFANDGLIALTGCPTSITYHDNLDIAELYINFLIKTFGKSNVFAEIMNHTIVYEHDKMVNCWDRPLYFVDKFNIKPIWTNDVHAAEEKHLEYLRKVSLTKKGYEFTAGYIRDKISSFKLAVDTIGQAKAEESFTSIDEIINKVEPIDFAREFKLPDATNIIPKMIQYAKDKLEKDISEKGLIYKNINLREAFQKEYDLFEKWSFWPYYAVLWDILEHAKKKNILYNVRGSASGSYILHLLDISTLHPIEHGLMFERFLCDMRLEKGDLPDVDVDIDRDKRYIVQDYARERWGFEAVGTYITYGHSSLVQLLSRVYEKLEFKHVPKKIIEQASHDSYESHAFKDWLEYADYFEPMYNLLYDTIDSRGRHACAMAPLPDDLPIPIEAYASESVIALPESNSSKSLQLLGLVKYDLLSLKTKAMIQALYDTTNIKAPIVIPEDDQCFQVFNDGKLSGIFQFDSYVARMINGRNKRTITSIKDLSDLTAFGRPGSLDYADIFFDETEDTHPPIIQEIFNETHNVLIYQEQVAKLFALISTGEINNNSLQLGIVALKELVPKHVDQSKTEKFKKKYEELRSQFIQGGQDHHNLDMEYLNELFESLKGYIRYGFNLSHSLSYANESATMAWYKYNFPHEFWTVVLQFNAGTQQLDKTLKYITDARVESGIKFQAPSINSASASFILSEDKIRINCPITMVKGLANIGITQITNELEKGPFISLADFNQRCPKLNKTQKLVMYESGMLSELKGTPRDLGILETKTFSLRGVAWKNPDPKITITGFVTSIEKCDSGHVITLDVGDHFSEEVKLLLFNELDEKYIPLLKEYSIKHTPSVKHLKEDTEIIAYVVDNQILAYKRIQYIEQYLPTVKDTNEGMKKALGFTVPEDLKELYEFAEKRLDKALGFVVDIEEKRTKMTNQRKLVLHSGRKIWFCTEDRTKYSSIMKKSLYTNENLPEIKKGDLVGATLVVSKKDEELMTYGQIAKIQVVC